MENDNQTQTVEHPCGAKSSLCPRFDLLPYHGLVRCAARFEKGEARYGHDNWRKGLTDKRYVIERAGHVMHHVAKLIGKLEGHLQDDGDDDAGAIAWGGMFLCEAMEALSKQKNCSGCGGNGKIRRGESVDWCPACHGTGKVRQK
ncbi:MAG TPA: DUF5664 domain-containing protein [Bryobacteraceae bacterium]|nr:DUF5664 domain-containing protein [Bryobacteraceae bacterium]